jgi:hypothetical protein
LANSFASNSDNIDNSDDNPFNGKIVLGLTKKAGQRYDGKLLEEALNKINTIFSLSDLVKRQSEVKLNNVYADVVDMGRPIEGEQVLANQ